MIVAFVDICMVFVRLAQGLKSKKIPGGTIYNFSKIWGRGGNYYLGPPLVFLVVPGELFLPWSPLTVFLS